MAILNKNEHKETIDIEKSQVIKAEKNKAELSFDKRDMKIAWPSFGRVIVSTFEFMAFSAISGACFFDIAWAVTRFVSIWVV